MGKGNYSDAFKRDAVAQITERGYPVAEVAQRLGVSQHSLYAWKRELTRMTEERDLLKKGEPLSAIGPRTMASAYFARDAK